MKMFGLFHSIRSDDSIEIFMWEILVLFRLLSLLSILIPNGYFFTELMHSSFSSERSRSLRFDLMYGLLKH